MLKKRYTTKPYPLLMSGVVLWSYCRGFAVVELWKMGGYGMEMVVQDRWDAKRDSKNERLVDG